jgi:hypothetical protein
MKTEEYDIIVFIKKGRHLSNLELSWIEQKIEYVTMNVHSKRVSSIRGVIDQRSLELLAQSKNINGYVSHNRATGETIHSRDILKRMNNVFYKYAT